jgi:hypothetical protein
MASGDTLLIFTPLHNEPPASNNATLDTRNSHPCLDFDASTDESAVFTAIMPRHYAGGGLTVYLHWAASSDNNNAHVCVWDAAFERDLDGVLDLDGDSFAAAQSSSGNPDGTLGVMTQTTIAFTDGAQMDSIAAGEQFRLKITRDVSAPDDMTGDAEIFSIEIKET